MPYTMINERQIWHEVVGTGAPVVLLHGAFGGAASFFAQTPALAAAGFQVYLPERSGHAHSPDIPGPFTYSGMADETIAYLDLTLGRRADLIGWSDGAVVALLVALKRPDLVRRMILIGQYYNSAGKVAASELDEWLKTPEAAAMLRQGYDPFTPDGPEHFPIILEKTLQMIATEPELDLAALSAISAPTLVLQGDRDIVTVQHSCDVVATIPAARLAILPGTHALPIELPEVVNPLLLSFLSASAAMNENRFPNEG